MKWDSEALLTFIFDSMTKIASTHDYDILLQELAKMGRDIVFAERCSIWLCDKRNDILYTKIAQDTLPISMHIDSGIVGTVVAQNKPVISNHVQEDINFNRTIDEQTGYMTKNMMVIPIKNQTVEVLGAIQVMNKKDNQAFTEEDLQNLTVATSYVAENIKAILLREEKLKAIEENKLKNKFISLVSHDLRSPFSSILDAMQMLHNDTKNPLTSEQKELLTMAIDKGGRLIDMIHALLDTTRLQEDTMQLILEKIYIREMVTDILNESQQNADNKGVILHNKVDLSQNLYGDFDLVNVLLRNIISNAIKFCNQGDSVEIFSYNEDSIAIKDTGVGIDPGILSNIFNRAVKTTLEGTKREKGHGLGLPLCYDIVKAHKGELSVEPNEEKGTLFIITLPLYP